MDDLSAQERTPTAAHESPTRMRVLALVNIDSKTAAATGTEALRRRLTEAFAASGAEAQVELRSGRDLPDALRAAVAGRERFDALAVGGGDGTIGTAAAALAGTGIPLGVLPLGTLNHFARDLGIPAPLELACGVIAEGHGRDFDVAEVNGRIFVNNSSIGVYPYMLETRDAQRRTLGLGKWGAMALAFAWMLRRFPVHRLTIRAPEAALQHKTPCAFIGNNRYALEGAALGTRQALDRGELCVYVAHSQSRLHFLLVMLKAMLGRMRPRQDFDEIRGETVVIASRSGRLRVALDGELVKMKPPLRYAIRRRALRVLVPPLRTG
jgi:diacylglycerol kinase family enzyme